ncbi:MAG: hypothetical protein KA175_00550 [Flavobacteriales bacterium]|nr:hypothetical protein [Flavobacteriales bacterium]
MAVCLKRLGAELPLMDGTRPQVEMVVYLHQRPVLFGTMKRDHLPCRAPLTPAMRALLRADACTQGQRTPKRLHLGWYNRWPDRFYTLSTHGPGLHLPHNEVAGQLDIELHIAALDPLFELPVLFHYQACDPVPKRWGGLRWVPQRWTPINPYDIRHYERVESPSGCVVDIHLAL